MCFNVKFWTFRNVGDWWLYNSWVIEGKNLFNMVYWFLLTVLYGFLIVFNKKSYVVVECWEMLVREIVVVIYLSFLWYFTIRRNTCCLYISQYVLVSIWKILQIQIFMAYVYRSLKVWCFNPPPRFAQKLLSSKIVCLHTVLRLYIVGLYMNHYSNLYSAISTFN